MSIVLTIGCGALTALLTIARTTGLIDCSWGLVVLPALLLFAVWCVAVVIALLITWIIVRGKNIP
ncbi:MAG: hypothetical protein AAB263_18925 [Planctomycetota bacterium]